MSVFLSVRLYDVCLCDCHASGQRISKIGYKNQVLSNVLVLRTYVFNFHIFPFLSLPIFSCLPSFLRSFYLSKKNYFLFSFFFSHFLYFYSFFLIFFPLSIFFALLLSLFLSSYFYFMLLSFRYSVCMAVFPLL